MTQSNGADTPNEEAVEEEEEAELGEPPPVTSRLFLPGGGGGRGLSSRLIVAAVRESPVEARRPVALSAPERGRGRDLSRKREGGRRWSPPPRHNPAMALSAMSAANTRAATVTGGMPTRGEEELVRMQYCI